jgi:hypothetical protein
MRFSVNTKSTSKAVSEFAKYVVCALVNNMILIFARFFLHHKDILHQVLLKVPSMLQNIVKDVLAQLQPWLTDPWRIIRMLAKLDLAVSDFRKSNV